MEPQCPHPRRRSRNFADLSCIFQIFAELEFPIPSHLWLEGLDLSLRVESDEESKGPATRESGAFSTPIIPSHLDLLQTFPSGSTLHLIDHVPKFNFAYTAAEEHPLALQVSPVVAPCGLAERAALSRNLQNPSPSLTWPSDIYQRHQQT